MRTRAISVLLALAWICLPAAAADRNEDGIVSRIQREPVQSRGLAAVGYSRHLNALEVEFLDGSIYRYLEVPLWLHRELMSADSKARFYNRRVRGKFRSVHVKAPSKR